MKLPNERWPSLLDADPRPWLVEATDPSARWLTLTALCDRPASDAAVKAARKGVLEDAGIEELIARLPDWDAGAAFPGHNSPAFAPTTLNLLADLGLRAGDDERVDRFVDRLLGHQDDEDRFQSFMSFSRMKGSRWGSLLCDHHAILEVLLRYERGADRRVKAGLASMTHDLTSTAQGPAWKCIPERASGFRGPGRKDDLCPQVTLEALRVFSLVPKRAQPANLLDVARTSLHVWARRGEEKPYLFGHGRSFKTVKWPTLWYDVFGVLDTLTRFPALWTGRARPEDRRALAELAACLVAWNFGAGGRVTPQSCYQGFETYSFGQKKAPSAIATARLCVVLRRLDSLTDAIGRIDVLKLGSSKGGTGTPVPPKAK